MPGITLLDWQKKYGTEKASAQLLPKIGGQMALCLLIVDTKMPITWPNAEFMNVV